MNRSYFTSYLRAFKQWDSFVLLNFTQQEEELLLCSETSVSVAIFFLYCIPTVLKTAYKLGLAGLAWTLIRLLIILKNKKIGIVCETY